jgi:hypothetical protein
MVAESVQLLILPPDPGYNTFLKPYHQKAFDNWNTTEDSKIHHLKISKVKISINKNLSNKLMKG